MPFGPLRNREAMGSSAFSDLVLPGLHGFMCFSYLFYFSIFMCVVVVVIHMCMQVCMDMGMCVWGDDCSHM